MHAVGFQPLPAAVRGLVVLHVHMCHVAVMVSEGGLVAIGVRFCLPSSMLSMAGSLSSGPATSLIRPHESG